MRAGRTVRIVSLVSVSQYSVRESRFDGTAHNVRSDYCRNLFATIGAHKLDRCVSRTNLRTGNHRGQSIQDVMFYFLDHFVR